MYLFKFHKKILIFRIFLFKIWEKENFILEMFAIS